MKVGFYNFQLHLTQNYCFMFTEVEESFFFKLYKHFSLK